MTVALGCLSTNMFLTDTLEQYIKFKALSGESGKFPLAKGFGHSLSKLLQLCLCAVQNITSDNFLLQFYMYIYMAHLLFLISQGFSEPTVPHSS